MMADANEGTRPGGERPVGRGESDAAASALPASAGRPFRRRGGFVALYCNPSTPRDAEAFEARLLHRQFPSLVREGGTTIGWTFAHAELDAVGAFWFALQATGQATKRTEVLVFPVERLVLLFSSDPGTLDHLLALWAATFDHGLVPLQPADLARDVLPLRERQAIARLEPSFQGQRSLWLEDPDDWLGGEFLLWLWWRGETQGGEFDLEEPAGRAGVRVAEATTECGQPRRARVELAFSTSGRWTLTVEAGRFAFSQVRLPADAQRDRDERDAERASSWLELHAVFAALLRRFLEARLADTWPREAAEITGWMRSRQGGSA